MTDMNKINVEALEAFERLNSREDLRNYSFDEHLTELIEVIATAKPAERLAAARSFDECSGELKLRGIHGTKTIPIKIAVFGESLYRNHYNTIYNIISVGEERYLPLPHERYMFENIPLHVPNSCEPEDLERTIAHAIAMTHGYSIIM